MQTFWQPGMPGYFHVHGRLRERRPAAGYFVGVVGPYGRALVFGVPGLGVPDVGGGGGAGGGGGGLGGGGGG